TAAPSYKKLGKITSTKVGSIYPTLTAGYKRHRKPERGGLARSDRFSIFLSGMSEAVMLPI
ncbi:hypothetical protein, partial [Burkholderia sp. GbtcB21]|uniref:hypothetical protein n=1 Tax=Burkholderia sp. GbtcB21 TaxID=2824766 RepID=UPI001C2FF619